MKLHRLLFPLAAAALTGSLAAALCGSAAAELGVRLAQQPNCKNPQTQAEINDCAGLSYQNADKKLAPSLPAGASKVARSEPGEID